VPTREIVLAPGALVELPAVAQRQGLERQVLLVADERTWMAAGAEVEALLARAGFQVTSFVLTGAVKADESTAEKVQSQVATETAWLCAVGAGTINDLTKHAATQRKRPYLTVPTAASMNGYTSALVALTVRGVKRTLPAQPPVAVVADVKVLRAAPGEMTAAGLGDLLSKPVSQADWRLAHLIWGEYFCDLPRLLGEDLEPLYLGHPEAFAQGNSEAIAALTEALLYSGISMVLAGSSAPASGGEHLISHCLDMRAAFMGREPSLHGAQVGVATLVMAALYERLLQLTRKDLKPPAVRPWADWERDLRTFYGPLGTEVATEFRRKYLPSEGAAARFRWLIEHWEEIQAAVRLTFRPPGELRAWLRAAGAPTTSGELGITASEFRATVLHAREIRARYTGLDLAYEVGLLPEALDEVLRASGVLP